MTGFTRRINRSLGQVLQFALCIADIKFVTLLAAANKTIESNPHRRGHLSVEQRPHNLYKPTMAFMDYYLLGCRLWAGTHL